MSRLEIQVLIGVCGFPIYEQFYATVRLSDNESVKEGDFAIFFTFIGEFEAASVIDFVQVLSQLVFLAASDDFQYVINITLEEPRLAF